MTDLREGFPLLLEHVAPLAGKIAQPAPEALTDPVFVTLDSLYEPGQPFKHGPLKWQSRDGASLPAEGDPCVVLELDTGEQWVIAWWSGAAGIGGGTRWYAGTSVPSALLGVDGDFYFRTTTDDVYEKTSGSWGSPIANLKGSTGAAGAAGAPGATGPAGPSGVATRTLNVIVDGAGAVLATGVAGDVEIGANCTIVEATLLADQVGSVVVDIWKAGYSSFPPVIGNSITSSAKPTLSSARKSKDSTLTGWTSALTAGDILRFNIDSVSTITRLAIALTLTS